MINGGLISVIGTLRRDGLTTTATKRLRPCESCPSVSLKTFLTHCRPLRCLHHRERCSVACCRMEQGIASSFISAHDWNLNHQRKLISLSPTNLPTSLLGTISRVLLSTHAARLYRSTVTRHPSKIVTDWRNRGVLRVLKPGD